MRSRPKRVALKEDRHKVWLILDSGAFSAWTRKVTINIDDYIAYIKANQHLVAAYVNLDVIPGEFGRVPSDEEVEASAAQGFENMLYMEKHGLHPMPVYHMGESLKWLDKMIDHGCDYIGISPANDRTTDQKRDWLDMVFDHICDADGWPKIKTHGFGVTSIPLMMRYPWYTADSTSWILFGVYGMILVPRHRNGRFVYDESPHSVFVSSKSKAITVDGKHFNSYSSMLQEHIREYLTECGVTVEEAAENGDLRSQINARFYRDFTEYSLANPRPFVRRPRLRTVFDE